MSAASGADQGEVWQQRRAMEMSFPKAPRERATGRDEGLLVTILASREVKARSRGLTLAADDEDEQTEAVSEEPEGISSRCSAPRMACVPTRGSRTPASTAASAIEGEVAR